MGNTSTNRSLDRLLPEGQLVNRQWFKARGVDRPLVDFWLRSGKLEAVSRGLYRRPGPPLKWEQVVYSLNEIGIPIHVGGRSALELQGLAHYLPLKGITTISLYTTTSKVPSWIHSYPGDFTLKVHSHRLFRRLPQLAVHSRAFGSWDWPIPYATIELALIEFLVKVRHPADFDLADKFFESATVLRPALIQELLLACTHVQAKRLFLWFANRHHHQWFGKLDLTKVNLGRGKRVIVKEGSLDTRYHITVPRTMAHGNHESVF